MEHRSFGHLFVFQQQLAETCQLVDAPHLFFLERHYHNVEVLVQFQNLVQVLLLHFRAGTAHLALALGKQDLVDYDVVDVDLELCQLLDQSLGLVHRQEFRDADSDESCPGGVLHLLVHHLRSLAHLLHLAEDLIQYFVHLLLRTKNTAHFVQQVVELFFESEDFVESLFEDVGEVEETQGMPSRGSIEDDHLKVHLLDRTRSMKRYLMSCEKDIASSIPGTEEMISLRRLLVLSSDSKRVVSIVTSTLGSISLVEAAVP